MTRLWLITSLAMMFTLVSASPLLAIGADTLTPEATVNPSSEPEKKPEEPKVISPEVTEEPKVEKPGEETAKKTETAEIKPIERSIISLFLENRLQINSSIGWVGISNKDATWYTSGITDLGVDYRLRVINEKLTWWAGFRYSPVAFTAMSKANNSFYRGVIEGYHFGSSGNYQFKPNLFAKADLELGYLVVSARQYDLISKDQKISKNRIGVNLGSGAYWQLKDKLLLGPHLRLGFGDLFSWQFAANLSLLF